MSSEQYSLFPEYDYTVRVSRRAKQPSLRVTPEKGLEVVVPERFNQRRIPSLLAEHRSWIENIFEKLPEWRPKPPQPLPSDISIQLAERTWELVKQPRPTSSLRIRENRQQQLTLTGDCSNEEACKQAVTRWLKNQAKKLLPALLTQICDETGLAFNNVSIRSQKTRWGSCSREKKINLNYKIIFLPYHLARHILVHELCHTVHLDHSRRFWNLVGQFDSNYKEHNKTLQNADHFMPGWIS